MGSHEGFLTIFQFGGIMSSNFLTAQLHNYVYGLILAAAVIVGIIIFKQAFERFKLKRRLFKSQKPF